VSDLPCSGQRICLRVVTRRFVCSAPGDGPSIKEIVRRTGHSRKLVRQVIRGERTDVFRVRQSSLETYLLRVVSEWATGRRRAERASDQQLQKVPSARTIARLMTTTRDHLNKADTITIAAIETGVPMVVGARSLIDRFHSMIRKTVVADLDPWIADASASLIASLATGITKDKDAVRAAITEPWSNGQTEGQITRLKLVKRQMYGRAKLDLLQARLIGAA
jgi:transposase